MTRQMAGPQTGPVSDRDLQETLRANPVCAAILDGAGSLGLPHWYLGAGAVAQTVWNQAHGYAPQAGIADYDLVYFDPQDLSKISEQAAEDAAVAAFGRPGARFDVTNEARVHVWYERKFGVAIPPYESVEAAIGTWPTTATSIGVTCANGRFAVCAPFGTDDLWQLIIRPNKTLVTRQVYEAKVSRWSAIWPKLTIIPWR